MWGMSSDIWERMRVGLNIQAEPKDVEEARLKREAERKVEESGRGECANCHEEIIKNEDLEVWESEYLLAYCNKARDHRHRPRIVWGKPNE